MRFTVILPSLCLARIYASRRHRLQRLFFNFPGGRQGLGLVILRLTVAFNAIIGGLDKLSTWGDHWSSAWLISLLASIVGFSLVAGFLTPLSSTAAAIGYVWVGMDAWTPATHPNPLCTLMDLNLGTICIALALLGPGAFSADARLFGLREIIIPESRRPHS